MEKIRNILLLLTTMSLNTFAQVGYTSIDDMPAAKPTIDKSTTTYSKTTQTEIVLGNHIWFDYNENGIQDLGELGLYGVEVQLYNNGDCTGEIIATTQSSDVGYYSFLDIPVSTDKYCIAVVYPDFWTNTLSHQGDTSFDSDVVAMNDTMGKIENISLLQSNESLDIGLHHKDEYCQPPVLDVNTVGIYDNTNTWAKRDSLDVEFENVIASGFCHEYHDSGPERGEHFSVHLDDRVGFSDTQRDELSRIFRYMSDPEIINMIDSAFKPSERHYWFNVASHSFVWYYTDWEKDFSLVESYIDKSRWSSELSDEERAALKSIAQVIFDKTEGINGATQYEPMKVYFFWDEDNTEHQDIIVPETSVVPKQKECVLPLPTGEIGDFVWFDADKNGQQDDGELGLKDIKVELYNGDTLLKSTLTDENGAYNFTSLEAGEYTLHFITPEGWSITNQHADGVEESLNSDADKITGRTASFTLNDAEKKDTYDVGMYITPQPSITITKETNGGKVDNIVEGDTITWTYIVSNTGNTPITNLVITDDKEGLISDCSGEGSLDLMNPSQSMTCTKIGTAILGSYENSVVVKAMAEDIAVEDNAKSSYVGKSAPVLTGSIGDFVWLDSNNNGIQESDEIPLSGIVVKLFDKSAVEKASTKTDSAGHYFFSDIVAGEYYIEFVLPSGYTVTLQDKGEDALDSDADVNGKTALFVLDEGENKESIDMGLYPMLVELGNRVWYDTNKNGIQDADEKQSIANVNVKLYKEDGTFVQETQTRDSGYYDFKDLIAGSYYIIFEIPENYKVSPQNIGTNDSDDSDANPTSGKTDIIQLIAGIDNRTVDMGLYQEAAKVGDRVWYDANKDGIQDDDENGVGDVTVQLYTVGNSEPIATTKTSENGIYLFDNVVPNDYYIVFTAPVGYTITEANRGDDSKDSDADSSGRTESFTLLAGTQNSTIDMGVYQNVVSLGDKVWLDANHNGLQDVGETGVRDVKVTVHSETNDFAQSVLTDENGNYLFTHLAAGEYSVEFEDIPYGHLITQKDVNDNENDLNDSDVFVNEDEKLVTQGTLLTPGENDLSWDMGIYKTVCLPGKAVLGNLVWEDFNKNGIQDIGERGMANIKAVLFNNDTDEKIAETITDENGLYEFANLDPEFNYYIQFTLPTGYVVSPQDQDDDIIDSDADANGKTEVISLSVDQINSTVDMGIHQEGSTLGDRVWFDEKDGISNGIQDEGENGVQDVKITLYSENGDAVKSTFTNASGEYHFTNVLNGNYTIGFSDLPDAYVFSIKDQGDNEEADSDANENGQTDIIVVDGIHNFINIDAGIKRVRTGDVGSDIAEAEVGKSVVIDVLANDNDGTYAFDATSVKITSIPDGAILSEDGKTLTVPNEGLWSVDPVTGAITFTPNDDFVGDPTPISYTVSDTQGNESGAEVVVNYPPLAVDDLVNAEVGKQVIVYVLDNDSNTSTPLDKSTVRIINPENGDEVESITVAGEGVWSTNSDGSITFTPEYGFENNPTPIEYTVKELSGDVSNRAIVTIIYPDAVDDVMIVPVGHTGDITVNVIENDSNNTDASLVSLGCREENIKSLTISGEGTWSVSDTGIVTFSAVDGFVNEPSDINYTVGLVSGIRSNCATIDVRFELLARDDSSLMNVGAVTLIAILNNDYGSLNPESVKLILPENIPAGSRVSDDGKTLTVHGEGIWSVNAEGIVSFSAEDGFIGTPTPINYSVENNNGLMSNIATITITVGAETTVIATDDNAEANNGNPIVIDVLSDDSGDLNGSTVYILDADGNRVDSRVIEGEGIWQVNDDQTITFTPEEGYIGTPTPIDYVIQDRNGSISNSATITIIGVCKCDSYEESISVMSNTAGILMFMLTLILTIVFFEREENMRYS
jgi:CshA-type fibril repeat protein